MLADPAGSGPLSPSQWLTFNTDDHQYYGGGITDDGNSIDMLRMYFDMQAQQEKVQPSSIMATPSIASPSSMFSFLNPPSPQALPPQSQPQSQSATVSMADIEQWHSLLANSGMASLSPAIAPAPSLPPSAFSPSMISTGSEVPVVDPAALFGSIFGQTPDSYMQQSTQHHQQAPQIKVEQHDDADYTPSAPVASTSKAVPVSATTSKKAADPPSRKRGVSALIIPNSIPEEPEMFSDSDSESEDIDSDEVQSKNKRKRGGATASKSRKTTTTTKRSTKAATSTIPDASHPHALVPVPQYSDKPSKAEYEKLSSKEKRQLRNKISARNFRHRRKAHIDTLEAEINDKDSVIGVLSEEVGTLRSENQGLRADIEQLKKNWESIAAKISAAAAIPAVAQPAPSASTSTFLSPDEDDLYGASGSLPALSPPSSTASTNGEDVDSVFDAASTSSTAATSAHLPSTSAPTKRTTRNSAASSSAASRPNTRKDLSGSGNTFWGASTSSAGAPWMGGRTMDVHTTFIPEHTLHGALDPVASMSEKPASRKMDSLGAYFANLQSHNSFAYGQNMNPALNNLSSEQVDRLREQSQQKREADPVKDGFFETNPLLSLRSDKLQDYRGQLYSKLAHNFAGIQAAQNASRAGTTLPEGMKPAFFAAVPSVSVEADLVRQQAQTHTATLQVAGALVTKTLFEKLSSAFWDAFTGEDPKAQKGLLPSSAAQKKQSLDAKKVADVIGGKARLAVVPATTSEKDLDALSEKMAHASLDHKSVLRLPKRHNSI